MARSKKKKSKKTLSQQVVSAGASGMPEPVKNFLGTRVVAGLIVLCVPLLLYSGIFSVDFENGRPHFSFNKEKAQEVESLAAEKIHDLRGEDQGFTTNASEALHSLISHEKNSFQPATRWGQGEGLGEKLTEGVDSFRNEVSNSQSKSWLQLPNHRTEEEPAAHHKGPFSNLKDRFDSHR